MLAAEAGDGVGVAREAVADAHGAPEVGVAEEGVPVAAHARGTGERARVVDEAEDVERDLGRECAEEVALEERGDRRGEEEELRGRALLDERVEVLATGGGGKCGEGGDVEGRGGVGAVEGGLVWGRGGRRGWGRYDGYVQRGRG